MIAALFFLPLVYGASLPIDGDTTKPDVVDPNADSIAGRAAAAAPVAGRAAAAPVTEPAADIITGRAEYEPSDPNYYTPNEIYKAGNKEDCHDVQNLIWKEECVPYKKRTCFTQQVEQCKDIYAKNCTAVIDEFEDRECFTVKELRCQLTESIDYKMVPETYTVQRCTKVNDRVCDTVYDLHVTSKDDFQCVDLHHRYCWTEEKIVKDRTCHFSVDFSCSKLSQGKGKVYCERTPTKKCYDTPRTISAQKCEPRVNTYCDKFSNDYPYPVEKQNCHSEPMKKCELEERTKHKKAKQYVYTKECRPVEREVCDKVDRKKLRQVCDHKHKNRCTYNPVEQCTEEEKDYCHMVEKYVTERVCVPEKKEIVDTTFHYI